MESIVAVVPAHNEQARIGRVIESALDFVQKVVVVDDHSCDDTPVIAKNKGASVIKLECNKGAGFATRTGCDYAVNNGADIIVTMDADGQHDPADIPRLLKPILENRAQIVFGMRPRDNRMPIGKRAGNAFLSFIARALFASDIIDTQTGFHAFRADCYDSLRWESAGYGIVTEIAYKTIRHKLRYEQVFVKTIYNDKKNGMRKRDGLKAIWMMLKWKAGRA
ncbi:MAG: glycosyltransferase family 2 protein [Candidatus Omnitrophica bacterium]|jgi:glycosyltransferase involved in cell wall biosynthesis|nr:glycosyltransferase family 2 protein [Candidatus Omnitrophota bacterium]